MLKERVPQDLEFHVSDSEEPEQFDELILTPTPENEQPESPDLTLEADSVFKAEEISFEGEPELEDRIRKAMKAYDAAMDDAAGMK